MTSSTRWLLGLLGALGSALLCGCAEETRPGPATPATTTGTATGTTTGTAGGMGGIGGSGSGGQGATGFSIVDVPTTDCGPLSASPTELYPADAMDPLYRLVPVGDRWAASADLSTNGFVLFDADGQNPSPALATFGQLDRIAGSSSGLSVATLTAEGAEYGRFDGQGAPLGTPATIATGSLWSVEVGRSGDEGMVVVHSGAGPQARGVSDADVPGTAFDLEPGPQVDTFSVAVAAAGPARFAIVWSDRRVADQVFRTFFTFADQAGLRGTVHEVHTGMAAQRTVQLVETESGFALLQELDGEALVVPLNGDGLVSGPARRLMGTVNAWGIASNGSELVVLAQRDDDREAIRALDVTAVPVGDWICLNPSSDEYEHASAIAVDGAGYAIIFRDVDESEQLVYIANAVQGS